MKILFTKSGTPKSGSWLMRGVQIADALNARGLAQARAIPNPEQIDLQWADVIVVVKRFNETLVHRAKKLRKRMVWDVLDFWKQPDDITHIAEEAKKQFWRQFSELKPDSVIFATHQMRHDLWDDMNWVSGRVVTVIPHHYRFGQPMNPIRETIRTVGYEGSERYLEGWTAAISDACARRGAKFLVNPGALAELDVALSVRGGKWRGYQTDNWKSNVKLANAQATGTPFIGLREKGCLETASGAEVWVESPADVEDALSALEAREVRELAKTKLQATAPNLGAILEGYRAICSELVG